ncbi:MAG: DUF1573 domain-containing protein [Cyclobacteriaceae bacterium]|nr:DUF1573 domain-containing protein [Cyclobacteriaceae bacterium]UYN85567.1 MAG: DUF1573 domain-containing protein [Cyclobacteriaceae bacterium]
MKRIIGMLVLIGATVVSFAQLAKPVKFNEEVFDFGSVIEEDGPVSHEFVFTNVGTKPLQILSVQPSCGCTTPGWSKEPIMPGKSGSIKAQYDPKGRPGYFNKSLTVTTDADNQPIILQIKGTVTSKNGFSPVEFQAVNGNLRLRSLSFNLGKVFIKDEFVVRDYEFYNTGVKPVSYSGKTEGPEYIRVTVEPTVVEPGKKGTVKVGYNGKMKGQYGFQSDHITLHTDDELQPLKGFTVYATLEDYFPELKPDELAKAPQLRFSAQAIEYGSMRQNQSVTKSIQFTNTGKTVLEIRSIQGNCTCIQTEADKTKLKPGESAAIKVSFNPQDRKGTQTKSVTVYSNDPQNPVQRITLTGVVD